MPSVVLFLEGRLAGYSGVLVGSLGGGIGATVGGYQRRKAQMAQQELDRRDGKLDLYKSNADGSVMWHQLGGAIPGLSLIPNAVAASKRYGLEDRLKAQGDKPGKA